LKRTARFQPLSDGEDRQAAKGADFARSGFGESGKIAHDRSERLVILGEMNMNLVAINR